VQTLAGCYVLARNESFIQLIYCTIQATNGYDTNAKIDVLRYNIIINTQ